MKQSFPQQADTTESRLDQQSDDPNTNSANTKNTKSKDRKLRFYTIQM
jgi:hypothetical protein